MLAADKKPTVKLDICTGKQTLIAEGKSVAVSVGKIAFICMNDMTGYISIPSGQGVPDGFCWIPMEVIKL